MSTNPPPMAESEAQDIHRITLEDAWQRFAVYDHNANRTNKRFGNARKYILVLGVFATFMALIYQIYFKATPTELFSQVVRTIVILLPITVSALLTGTNKLERGVNWVLLRSSAENLKYEIFVFRAKAGIYSDEKCKEESREVKLARQVKSVGERLMKTEVNQSGLYTYNDILPPPDMGLHKEDDGFSFITPDQYVAFRLENQMNFYKGKSEKLDRQLRRLHWQIIIIGALGTLIAAIGFEVWIAVTTAVVTALTTFMEYNQLESTLTSYNQAGTDLESIRMWWRALPAEMKKDSKYIEKLVGNAEGVMKAEQASWVQEMKDALATLYEEDQETLERMKEMAAMPPDITPAQMASLFGIGDEEEFAIVDDSDERPMLTYEEEPPKLAWDSPDSVGDFGKEGNGGTGLPFDNPEEFQENVDLSDFIPGTGETSGDE